MFNLKRDECEPCLTDENKMEFDLLITQDELFDAIMTLKSNKVPGLDGLTIELYHKFWPQN